MQQLEGTLANGLPAYPCVWIGGPAQLGGSLCCVQQHHWVMKEQRDRNKVLENRISCFRSHVIDCCLRVSPRNSVSAEIAERL